MKDRPHPKTLALNEWEREEVNKKLTEINKQLLDKSMKQIEKESQLLHRIIEIGLSRVEITNDGNIIIK